MMEVHTSELTDSCPQRAFLRINGKEHRQAETALFRGLLSHAVLEVVSMGGVTTAADQWAGVVAKCHDEGRSVAAAVAANEDSICDEVDRAAGRYVEQVMPLFDEVVGVELPVSLVIDVDGELVRFASHIDKLAIGADPYTGERSVMILDWKWRDTAPMMAYLVRNLQFGMYQYAAKWGGVQIDGWPWMLPDDLPLRAYWVHLPYLKPYKKKTTSGGETYAAGESRPLNKVLIEATCNDDDAVYAAFADRVRMMRLGFWPAIPDPVGCGLCQSSYACKAWGNHGN